MPRSIWRLLSSAAAGCRFLAVPRCFLLMLRRPASRWLVWRLARLQPAMQDDRSQMNTNASLSSVHEGCNCFYKTSAREVHRRRAGLFDYLTACSLDCLSACLLAGLLACSPFVAEPRKTAPGVYHLLQQQTIHPTNTVPERSDLVSKRSLGLLRNARACRVRLPPGMRQR